MSKIERPEALAQFAESARRGERKGVAGLTATNATAPIPTDPEAKDEAATRVLAEGATGMDLDSEEAVDQLPDRILESRQKVQGEGSEGGGETPLANVEAPYDATRDPRTGRPPSPLEAQQLARENELERLSRAQTSEGAEEVSESTKDEAGDAEAEETSGNADATSGSVDEAMDMAPPDQAPARMVSPQPNDEEAAAVDDLVSQGVTREWAEELVKTHGTDPETLKAAWANTTAAKRSEPDAV